MESETPELAPSTVDNRDTLARQKSPRIRNRGLRSKSPTYQGSKLKSVTVRVDLSFANLLRKEARKRKVNLTVLTRRLADQFNAVVEGLDRSPDNA